MMAVPLLALYLAAMGPDLTPTTSSHCVFTGKNAAQLDGSCGSLLYYSPQMTLIPSKKLEGGIWQLGATPASIWSGTLTDDTYTAAPIQLEIYGGASGILRTLYGWFPVTAYRASASAVMFDLDSSGEVPPGALDVQIIQRASAILSTTAVWNRADNRKCPETATTFSIYCAAEKATELVTGGTGLLDHRRPALEVIRGVVDDRSKGRKYDHRLMDYNNDSTTTLSDVQTLFHDASMAVNDKAWLRAHGFAVGP